MRSSSSGWPLTTVTSTRRKKWKRFFGRLANSSGVLGTGPYSDTDTSDSTGGGARQTFLVELDTNSLTIENANGAGGGVLMPEPGFYGLLALGLGGLFFAMRWKKAWLGFSAADNRRPRFYTGVQ